MIKKVRDLKEGDRILLYVEVCGTDGIIGDSESIIVGYYRGAAVLKLNDIITVQDGDEKPGL